MDLKDQLIEAKRVLKQQKEVYPKRVELRKMKPETAVSRMKAMEAIVQTLEKLISESGTGQGYLDLWRAH